MDFIRQGWFSEVSPRNLDPSEGAKGDREVEDLKEKKLGESSAERAVLTPSWHGQTFCLEVVEEMFNKRSEFQDVLVFESKAYGRVLVLDGMIQCTERDEFAYQEMLTHLAMFSHPNPAKVLIVGGGDGGIAREVLKHDCVQSVVLCEIDKMVVDAAKAYFPHMSSSFTSPKLTLVIGDGFKYVQEHKNEFDVIITDSSDPTGPAEVLFGKLYYEQVRDALRDGGVLSSQGECPWLDGDLIRHLCSIARAVFPSVGYAVGSVPTYPSGLMGYLVCCKDSDRNLSTPVRECSPEKGKTMALKYYNAEIHRAAFALPQFIKEKIEQT